MKKQVLQSANFKRDYVAASAILIFIAIVISELTLAVAIPTYLYRENAMALQVRKLKLLEDFDWARRMCGDVKPRGTAAEMELKLVAWDLDLLAVYLRTESDKLTSDEIARLQSFVDDALAVLNHLNSGKSFSRETAFETRIYVNSLLPKKGGPSNVGKKPAR